MVHQLYLELVKVKALRPASSERSGREGRVPGAGGLPDEAAADSSCPSALEACGESRASRPAWPAVAAEHSLVEIDDALNRLAAINPALRRVVELRVFEGLTREEIAREMGCGTATVARHWSFARNWLEEAFAGTPGL